MTWRQSGAELELARVDADPASGTAKVTVTVPATAVPGPAEIQIGSSTAAELTVTAR